MPETKRAIYPAITLWQPWATLVAIGAKPFEFRSWPAPKRLWGRRVAIHAGARPVRRSELAELEAKLSDIRAAETGLDVGPALDLLDSAWRNQALLPRSSIVCLATLGEPIRNEALAAALGIPFMNDSDRNRHTNWGWPLSDIAPLTPLMPATGRQGWWNWTDVEGLADA